MTDVRRGFMCATDFLHHLGQDVRPAKVCRDLETLREHRPCVAECGIVEVEVSVVHWVQEPDFSLPAPPDATLPVDRVPSIGEN